jgi:hypothetical protein
MLTWEAGYASACILVHWRPWGHCILWGRIESMGWLQHNKVGYHWWIRNNHFIIGEFFSEKWHLKMWEWSDLGGVGMITFLNFKFWLNELLISPWYLNGWEFSQKHANFFWGSKACTSYLSTCSSSRCILIPVPIWYVQNMRPVQQCKPTNKGWSHPSYNELHVFEESWWQAWWFMFGFALVKHCPCDGSYVTQLSVCTFVVQRPFPFPPLPDPTIKLLILVAVAQTPVVHN